MNWTEVLDAYEVVLDRMERGLEGETLGELGELTPSSPPLDPPTPAELERYTELAQRAADLAQETREVLAGIADELGEGRRRRSAALGYVEADALIAPHEG